MAGKMPTPLFNLDNALVDERRTKKSDVKSTKGAERSHNPFERFARTANAFRYRWVYPSGAIIGGYNNSQTRSYLL